MSSHIILNKWFGADRSEAARKVAKVFRMNPEEGTGILLQLSEGKPWQFDYKVSDDQMAEASSYLRQLGFQVESKPVIENIARPDEELDMEDADEKKLDLGFHGKSGSLFGIMVGNLLLNILTLGIYHFWGLTRVRRFMWSNTSFNHDRFSYHGTGGELFRGFLKLMGLILLIAGALTLARIYGGEALGLPDLGPVVGENLIAYIISILFSLAMPALMVGAMRYRLSRTAWRGIRFSFRGTRGEALKIYYKGFFLTILTLGLYWPFFKVATERFWRENSYFGDRRIKFTGKGRDLFGSYILALVLSVLTLGLYLFWFQARLKRYLWSHTGFARGTFRFTATGWQFFALKATNLLILVLTLGLGYPWVVVRNQNFLVRHLSLEGASGLDRVVQQAKNADSFGEAAIDAFDIPVGIG